MPSFGVFFLWIFSIFLDFFLTAKKLKKEKRLDSNKNKTINSTFTLTNQLKSTLFYFI